MIPGTATPGGPPVSNRMRNFARTALALVAAATLLTVVVPAASGAVLGPSKGRVFTGVSDDGTVTGFRDFEARVGKHPAVLQTFHPWGNGLDRAFDRWRALGVRPMLHMSTADDDTRAELITPRQIALGLGDDYLLRINEFFDRKKLRAYIRPLGEPNRCLNPYSAVTCDGRQKGGDHRTLWYKRAFRRIAVIVRGGLPTARIDRKLQRLSMPPVNYGGAPRPAALPAAPVSLVWSPLPAGSPKAKGNWPGDYWPGTNFVDWAGTDFYSEYPHWKDLNKFFRGKRWKRKPVALTEFGVAGRDQLTFHRKLFTWIKKRPRVRMTVYYRGFGAGDATPANRYDPMLYPDAIRVLRNRWRDGRYVPFAYAHAGTRLIAP